MGILSLHNFYSFPDYLQHRVNFFQHVDIREAQHLQTEAGQIVIPPLVFRFALFRVMLAAIHFHHQIGCGTVEIDDVAAEGFLAIELHAFDLLPAHPRPKQALGVGHVFAQLTGGLFEIFVVGFQ